MLSETYWEEAIKVKCIWLA